MAGHQLDDFLNLTPEERRKKTFSEKKRSYGKRKFTKEEIITFLIKNKLDTSRKLENFRKDGEPTVYDCKKIFGSWKETKEEVFGDWNTDIFDNEPECDAEYLVKVVIENNLWTWRAYLEARKKRPDIVPSANRIRKHWRAFSDLIRFSKAYSVKHTAAGFLKLKKELGRTPTNKDCDEAGINLERLINKFGGKRELDQFVKDMELIQNAVKK